MYTVPFDFVFLYNNVLENSTKIYSDENETPEHSQNMTTINGNFSLIKVKGPRY